MNDDLDVLKTFNDFGLIKDSTLVVRFKLILVMFLLEGFTNIETNTLITEPLSVTLRLDTIFGKATNNMALHVGKICIVDSKREEGQYRGGRDSFTC